MNNINLSRPLFLLTLLGSLIWAAPSASAKASEKLDKLLALETSGRCDQFKDWAGRYEKEYGDNNHFRNAHTVNMLDNRQFVPMFGMSYEEIHGQDRKRIYAAIAKDCRNSNLYPDHTAFTRHFAYNLVNGIFRPHAETRYIPQLQEYRSKRGKIQKALEQSSTGEYSLASLAEGDELLAVAEKLLWPSEYRDLQKRIRNEGIRLAKARTHEAYGVELKHGAPV